MRKLAYAAILLAAACSSGGGASTKPAAAPAPSSDAQQLAELRTSMTELLERLDVLNDRINRLEEEQAAGSRRQAAGIAEPVPVAPVPQPPAPAQSAAVVNAQIAGAYRDAIILFGRNQRVEARAAFQKVFDADPRGDLADNALFWIGETYFDAGQYTESMRYYERVAKDYSDQNKAPDALFKLAMAYEKTSDLQLAKKTLEEVISRYPYSAPAASARSELKRIKY